MIIVDQAIVLHSQKTGELDLTITLFTIKMGKIFAKAKGASKITSTRLSSLQPGNTIKFSLHEKNNQYWINQSQAIYSFLQETKNITQVGLLFYLLEFCYKILPQNLPLGEVYTEISKAIQSIHNNQVGTFIRHEINIVEKLGYGLPSSIQLAIKQNNLKQIHQLLKQHLEIIMEKKLESPKLLT